MPLTPIGVGTSTGASSTDAAGTARMVSAGSSAWARNAPSASATSVCMGPTRTRPQRRALMRRRTEPSPASEP